MSVMQYVLGHAYDLWLAGIYIIGEVHTDLRHWLAHRKPPA